MAVTRAGDFGLQESPVAEEKRGITGWSEPDCSLSSNPQRTPWGSCWSAPLFVSAANPRSSGSSQPVSAASCPTGAGCPGDKRESVAGMGGEDDGLPFGYYVVCKGKGTRADFMGAKVAWQKSG